MAVTRLSGGLTPANGSDPRTFPAIWNATADDIEAAEADIAALESDVTTAESNITALQNGKANIVNTNSNPGKTIYVGSVTPTSPVTGDVWIRLP